MNRLDLGLILFLVVGIIAFPEHLLAGEFTTPSGETYKGDTLGGKPHGKGKAIFLDGSTYDGEWKNGKRDGQGIQVTADGSRYEGTWKKGTMYGRGTWYFSDGDIYDGFWENGRKNGWGKYKHSNGDIYEGDWSSGHKHGQGVYIEADGDIYDGQWKDGKKNGLGVQRHTIGSTFNGNWEDGKKSGRGIHTHSNGDIYEGDWSNGRRHGRGIYIEADTGSTFNGNWEDGKRSGRGIYTHSSGQKFKGYWKNNERHEGVSLDEYGRSIFFISAGKIITRQSLKHVKNGTGFIVNKHYVLTAEHMVRDCSVVMIGYRNDQLVATVVTLDWSNDLGLLRLFERLDKTAKFRVDDIRLGEAVMTYGYPVIGQSSKYATVSGGKVTRLAGQNDDSRYLQYNAESYPGNSGGPLLDVYGNVVGVISSVLDDSQLINVYYAIKSRVAEVFLSASAIDFKRGDSTQELAAYEIADKASEFTVLVECWQ